VRKGFFIAAGALMVVSAAAPAFAEGGCAWSAKQNLSVEAPKASGPVSTAASGTTALPSGGRSGS